MTAPIHSVDYGISHPSSRKMWRRTNMHDLLTSNRTIRIRELNDAFRQTFQGGKVMLSASVAELPDMVKAQALARVASFTEFNEDNDPHNEHDFVSFELCGRKFFGKIDYCDEELAGGSEDPSDPAKTIRVLTVMLAEDY